MTDFTLGLCGLGLIGSSIARSWLPHGRVLAMDPDPDVISQAASLGVETVTNLRDIAAADLVVLASPTAVNTKLLLSLVDGDRRPVVMDAGSAKTEIVRAWQALDSSYPFVATHPMAGSELSGFAAGSAELFVDAAWPVVVDVQTDPAALAAVVGLIRQLGAWPIPVDEESHDEAVAEISHLPHLLAGSLGRTIATSRTQALAISLGAGSFRDLSRVSASPPARTAEFITANRLHAAERARKAASHLLAVADLLDAGSEEELKDWLMTGHDVRLLFENRSVQRSRVTAGTSLDQWQRVLLDERDTGNRILEFAHDQQGWDMKISGTNLPRPSHDG